MVILGGLEIVVGGYFVHKYHKNKNEKKRLIEDAQQRRNNSFPGAKSPACPQQQPVMPQQQQQPQKFHYYAVEPQQFQPRPHTAQPLPPQHQYQHQHPSPPLPYTIPRRPVPQQQPQQQPHWQQQIQPLQRADSMATLSRMPIANGSRYHDANPPLPPRPQLLHTQSIPQQQSLGLPYSNNAFSVSAPSFERASTSPIPLSAHGLGRGNTVDDNWEAYDSPVPNPYYAPTVSTQLGEVEDPPPPYRP